MLDRLLPWLFGALAGPICLFLALSVPTGEVPDEGAHALRAESLLYGEVIGRRVTTTDAAGRASIEAGVTAHFSLLQAASTFDAEPIARKHLDRARLTALTALAWDEPPVFVAAPNTAVYLPIFYVPAAIGLAAGRLAGQGPHASLLTARLVNALVFLSLGSLALAWSRAARGLMFAALCLPMTLALAGSVNPDGLLIATAAIGAAALSRGTEATFNWRWLAGVCLALLGAAKPCYVPMAVAMLASMTRRDLGWRRLRPVAAATLPGLTWALFAAATVAVPFARPSYLGGPLWPGDPATVFHATDPGAQLRVLASGPWRLLTLPIGTLWGQARLLLASMIGVLGRLDLVLPLRAYPVGAAALFAAASLPLFRAEPGGRAVTRPGAAAIAVGLAITVQAIFLLQYLSWTTVGAASIDGVQGRYFLPLLPFAGLAVSAFRLRAWPALATLLLALPVALAAVDAVLLARVVLVTYYLG